MSHNIPEPPPQLDDTSPNRAWREESIAGWRRAVGLLSLGLAAVLTVGTTLLLLMPTQETPAPETIATPEATLVQPTKSPGDFYTDSRSPDR